MSSHLTYVDAIIIDGNFYLHLLKDLPISFGDISRKIIAKLCNLNANRIDPRSRIMRGIKDKKQMINYQIIGPVQKRPSTFTDALRNDAFKDSSIGFLVNSWDDNCFADIIGQKVIYVTHREHCFHFTSSVGMVYKVKVDSLCSSHEEADSQMFLHLHSMEDNSNVVIRFNDADVLNHCYWTSPSTQM